MISTSDLAMANNKSPAALLPNEPCILVIFGIAGDLAKRSLFPALCHLGSAGLLNENFHIIGCTREMLSTESLQAHLTEGLNTFVKTTASKQYGLRLLNRISTVSGNFTESPIYENLNKKIAALINKGASKNCLFYFSTPPQLIQTITSALHNVALLKQENYFRRIIIEKPFGQDLPSSKALNKSLLSMVKEEQLFRIDHFLGKEMVRNLLTLRFANRLFENVWNCEHIDHIQITVAESLGVETRGNFYETTGALRDMVPNHLFQMLSLIAMECPDSFSAEDIQIQKLKALKSMQPFTAEQINSAVVRGQYGKGKGHLDTTIGYRSEQNVEPQSNIETYVALKLFLDTPRWQNVPFYLRTGKRMPLYQTEINIQFKPTKLFSNAEFNALPNLLNIRIQPKEKITLRFNTKIPGTILQHSPVKIEFDNGSYFNSERQTGYEIILHDCMKGDHQLFKTAEMVETEWSLVQPILDAWQAQGPAEFPNYAAGTYGPPQADELLARDGRNWLV